MKKPEANVPELHDASSGGLVLFDPTGKMVMRKGVKLDAHSNNEAEYAALEVGL